jgi:hypothetical protein
MHFIHGCEGQHREEGETRKESEKEIKTMIMMVINNNN